jgi:glutamate formiminotransferase
VDELFESVPNFSEGRRTDVIDAVAGAVRARAFLLDTDADPDHNRVVVSLAGVRSRVLAALVSAVGEAVERIDMRTHAGVHPRVGAADVVPVVPLGATTLDACRELAHELGESIWEELRVPVYFYGHGSGRRLADIRAGRATPDVGGPEQHPTAGAVSVGARPSLVAFNVILHDYDLVGARALARSIRESGAGLRGVQALAFQLSAGRVQLSMNLFRLDETAPADVIAELRRRNVAMGAEQVVGLCPAAVASPVADGRLLEGRLAAVAASEAAARCAARSDEEHLALAVRLRREAAGLAALTTGQDEIVSGAERAVALVAVLRAAGVLDSELEAMLRVSAQGLRAALSPATEALYELRIEALERGLRSRS